MEFCPFVATPISQQQALSMDALVLAYVGDGVQSLYVRTYLACTQNKKAGALHSQSIGMVSAVAQAEEADAVRAVFTAEEDDVYRKARNHKNKSAAKNASTGDYRKASGLEAVWGYLYLTGQTERLAYLLALAHRMEENV